MSTGFRALGDELYATTRRMLEVYDVHGENGMPWMGAKIPHDQHTETEHECIQAWLLLAYYDFMRKPEQQALLTAGRAFRLLQLSNLLSIDKQDGGKMASEQLASSSNAAAFAYLPVLDESWRETEEKRRTVWAAFILDRLSGMLNDRLWALQEELVSPSLDS